jgi:hypothetical protein
MTTHAVLLYDKCPTGIHVGSVAAYYTGFNRDRLVVPWPPEYLCRCEDPRAGR